VIFSVDNSLFGLQNEDKFVLYTAW